MSRVLGVLWLTLLWVLLWRDADPVNVAGGALLAIVLVTVGRNLEPGPVAIRPVAVLKFIGVFAYKLLEANIVLAREVVTPQNRIETGIVAVPLPGCSPLLLTLTGNAVSLTPGTLTVEVATEPEPVLFVHVLHLHDIDHARADVLEIAQLLRDAFEPDARLLDDPRSIDREAGS